MKGVIQRRIDDVKDIDLIAYLQDRYPEKFSVRKNGEQLVYRNNKSLVIYRDHAYDFGEVRHAYKDSIYVEQMLSGCTFTEAVERLEVWKAEQLSKGTVSLNLFDNLDTDIDNDNLSKEEIVFITNDISNLE